MGDKVRSLVSASSEDGCSWCQMRGKAETSKGENPAREEDEQDPQSGGSIEAPSYRASCNAQKTLCRLSKTCTNSAKVTP